MAESLRPDPVVEFLSHREKLMRGLAESARETCREFVSSRQCSDGGFSGRGERGERGDLYYTFFAMADLTLLGVSFDSKPIEEYLSTFGSGESLDVVHLCCLLRCHNLLAMNDALVTIGVKGLGRFLQRRKLKKTLDLLRMRAETSSRLYDLFLIAQTGREMGVDVVPATIVQRALDDALCEDGGYSEPGVVNGTTTVTAAAVWLNATVNGTRPNATIAWLESMGMNGPGFRATPHTPFADLLSTATAIHALTWMDHDMKNRVPDLLSFIESCWREDGSFGASPICGPGDVEYVFYGLTALATLL